jgi:excinuclease ABC subunit B
MDQRTREERSQGTATLAIMRFFSLPPCGGGSGRGSTSRGASRVHKPHLDEMHGPESLPYRPGRATPRKPSPDDAGPGGESKIWQPTSTREANSLGPAPAARRGTGVD